MKKDQLDKINDLRDQISRVEMLLKDSHTDFRVKKYGTIVVYIGHEFLADALTGYRDQLKAELAGLGYEGE